MSEKPKPMTRDERVARLKANPRFVEGPKSGKGSSCPQRLRLRSARPRKRNSLRSWKRQRVASCVRLRRSASFHPGPVRRAVKRRAQGCGVMRMHGRARLVASHQKNRMPALAATAIAGFDKRLNSAFAYRRSPGGNSATWSIIVVMRSAPAGIVCFADPISLSGHWHSQTKRNT
jgi:hypothetical protein